MVWLTVPKYSTVEVPIIKFALPGMLHTLPIFTLLSFGVNKAALVCVILLVIVRLLLLAAKVMPPVVLLLLKL